jgi:hypothetical protein
MKKWVIGVLVVLLIATSVWAATRERGRAYRYVTTYGQQTIDTGGTAEALAIAFEEVVIRAMSGNSGYIYVGDSSVDSTNGFELAAGQALTISGYHAASTIYLDTSSDGDKICYWAHQ